MNAANKTTVVIHCLATPRNFMSQRPVQHVVDKVTDWHVNGNGWAANAYAQIIHFDGTKAGGRDRDNDGDFFEEIGAHAKGFNRVGIGIALNGGQGGKATDKFSNNFTEAQRLALWDTLYDIEKRFGRLRIIGHNEIANKACPSFTVSEFLKEGDPRKRKPKVNPVAAVVGASAGASALAFQYTQHWPYVVALGTLMAALFIWKVRK